MQMCVTSISKFQVACRFFKQAPDTSIFTEDVVFVDHIGPRIGMMFSSVVGRKAYSQHIWLLRFHASLIFSRCEVHTLSHALPSLQMPLYRCLCGVEAG